ncbi:unnamed protein product [Callosobruchus maculatus]|uniref:Uncharacterized protein n=1 Tax=Callosobruchus maculatus TaxID=64391 RepID=A0A653CVM4_CALMS|nr:unnamed protein product [Callosobruchus maculatus]
MEPRRRAAGWWWLCGRPSNASTPSGDEPPLPPAPQPPPAQPPRGCHATCHAAADTTGRLLCSWRRHSRLRSVTKMASPNAPAPRGLPPGLAPSKSCLRIPWAYTRSLSS